MRTSVQHIGTTARLASVLALLILLPAIFYSAYELTSLTRSEALLGDIYRQQLDVVLFSLNQYAWDIANSWANSINAMVTSGRASGRDTQRLFASFLRDNPGIRCVFFTDSLLRSPELVCSGGQPATGPEPGEPPPKAGLVAASLQANGQQIKRLFELRASGYRKLSPIALGDSTNANATALAFITGGNQGTHAVAGFVIDAGRFVRDLLGQKLNEVAGDNFLLAVNRKGSDQFVYRTGDMSPGEIRQTKQLWLFPDYVVGIRLKGQTIEEIVRERFYRNMALIALLDVVLIAGAWFVFRTVKREVELAQLKSDFVSNVSHELKTPLSLIRMFGETLQMKRVPTEEKKQEYYDTIVQESERLTRLVNNILNFSRIEAGRKEYHFETVDLNSIIRGVLKSYESHLVHLGFSLSLELDDGTPAVSADAEAVSEALLNMMDNAIKYSNTEKLLRIRTGPAGGGAYVDVEDHGIGIEHHQQKKIFEKFYRVSSGAVHNTKGSGLGLTLVKHIMDAHHGTVTVRSEPGHGSTFRLSFPPVGSPEA